MKLSKEDITHIQETLYKNLKRRANTYEGPPSKELITYKRDQKEASLREFSFSSEKELLIKVISSDIVYLGDLHTLDQNTKNLERIFRFLNDAKKKFIFGLEFVLKTKQEKIDFFLNGHLTELEFLESINYEKSWKFPWKHYRTIFDFSKLHKIPILALNSTGTLKQRDKEAAKTIVDFRNKNKDFKIIVLFGELHIVANKIPADVSTLSPESPNQLIIHQNLDNVFWKIKNLDPSIIKFSENEFSLQVSPPWIKYESMINWWENIINDPEYDIHEYILEKSVESLSSEVGEKFLFFSQTLNHTLNIKIPKISLENFNILSFNNLEKILTKIKEINSNKIEFFLKKLVTNGIYFKLPKTFDYVLPNFSFNKIAGISGLHIRSILLNNYYPKFKKNDFFFHFFGNFFASYISVKIFNPYKKCDLYLDIDLKSKAVKKSDRRTYILVKSILERIKERTLNGVIFESNTLFDLFLSSRIIGYFFAETFHDNIDIISDKCKTKVTQIAFSKIIDAQDLYSLYELIFSKKDLSNSKKRIF